MINKILVNDQSTFLLINSFKNTMTVQNFRVIIVEN